ncbi:MAG: acireductone synthase [Candidatus Melainabacteria bacterium]|nr:acireductone synthase [Candidatus Melainabacteria bacterium]
MITKARCILIDIEGTTSAISFVYDVLFPFARTELREYLRLNWRAANVQKALAYLAVDLGYSNTADWFNSAEVRQIDPDCVGDADRETDKISEIAHQNLVVAEVERLMNDDVKSTGLKELQGLIWAVGYGQGKLSSHVFDDVAPAFKEWKEAGVALCIFSSGSINAQKVFFKHTKDGDLSDYLSGYYDTTTGPKREAESYRLIAADAGFNPSQCLFLSDVEPELQAARDAGMKVALVARPGNATMESESFAVIQSFDQISVVPER